MPLGAGLRGAENYTRRQNGESQSAHWKLLEAGTFWF
jgi:hypothetical protein